MDEYKNLARALEEWHALACTCKWDVNKKKLMDMDKDELLTVIGHLIEDYEDSKTCQ